MLTISDDKWSEGRFFVLRPSKQLSTKSDTRGPLNRKSGLECLS